MRIRIMDRILVALAGILLMAACAGVVAQVFFSMDVTGFAARLLSVETTTGKIIIGAAAGTLLIIVVYCLLMLFRHRRRKDKFVLQKLESGDLAISLKTLETMVQKCVDQHHEIKTESIRLENQRDGLLIRIRGTVAGGISIPLTVDTLQKQVKQYVTACSGVEVKGIRIQIESSGEDAKDAPFLIEPPANNRLPKGAETPKAQSDDVQTVSTESPAADEKSTSAVPSEDEKPALSEESAAAAAMAAAASMMENVEIKDDRPIHQQLFSTQEEPCIMPLPPENLETVSGESEDTDRNPEAENRSPETDGSISADEAKGAEHA